MKNLFILSLGAALYNFLHIRSEETSKEVLKDIAVGPVHETDFYVLPKNF